tara:strand:+ start:4032 stop:5027 length:996 start_codon:yes stop_codon:yes gene_type:complete
MTEKKKITYCQAIFEAYDYLLDNYPNFFVIGQGLWSPWYVGNTMNGLEKKYGKNRVIDSPVAENATTGAALGAALTGKRPMVVHPRMDFMILAADAMVNQASKWQSMMGGNKEIPLTVRGIINRGGEQGAQHSQALHAWYGHIPGLRVVMPYSPSDARDLLISSVLSNDPVLYIDDRWCYDFSEEVSEISELKLHKQKPVLLKRGIDATLVGVGYTTHLCMQAAELLKKLNIIVDVIDLRVVNPLLTTLIIKSVSKTKKLIVVDGGWKNYGLGAELIASVAETMGSEENYQFRRITIKDSPAPTSSVLENYYYPNESDIVKITTQLMDKNC